MSHGTMIVNWFQLTIILRWRDNRTSENLVLCVHNKWSNSCREISWNNYNPAWAIEGSTIYYSFFYPSNVITWLPYNFNLNGRVAQTEPSKYNETSKSSRAFSPEIVQHWNFLLNAIAKKKILFIVEVHLAIQASLQTLHLNPKKQIFQINLTW